MKEQNDGVARERWPATQRRYAASVSRKKKVLRTSLRSEPTRRTHAEDGARTGGYEGVRLSRSVASENGEQQQRIQDVEGRLPW